MIIRHPTIVNVCRRYVTTSLCLLSYTALLPMITLVECVLDVRTSGGSCIAGDPLKAYEFIHKYGISDDTCTPYVGLSWLRGFVVANMTTVEDVQSNQCYTSKWRGSGSKVPRYDLFQAHDTLIQLLVPWSCTNRYALAHCSSPLLFSIF
jgi:hypothetical protein